MLSMVLNRIHHKMTPWTKSLAWTKKPFPENKFLKALIYYRKILYKQ